MQPYKNLIDRIEALKETIPVFRIMAEAETIHANYHNWQKEESVMMQRWFALCYDVGLDPWKIKPGESTYDRVKRRVLTRSATIRKFNDHGYDSETAKRWQSKGDPRHVESFKRVAEVVRKYETMLQKPEAVS